MRDGEQYILSIEHGGQLSIESAGKQFDLGFIVRFASLGDRNYYVGGDGYEDAAHETFKAFVGPLLAPDGVIVFDFVDGLVGRP